VEGRSHLVQHDREVLGRNHRLQQIAQDDVQLIERQARRIVAIHRQIGQRVFLGKSHQGNGQAQHLLVQPFGMQLRMMEQMRQRGIGFVGGMQQPERGDVTGTEFDDVLAGLAVKTVERADFGLQGVEQATQHLVQGRGRLDRHAGRDETRVQFVARTRRAAHPRDRYGQQMIACFVLRQQSHVLAQVRQLGSRCIGIQIGSSASGLRITRLECRGTFGFVIAANFTQGMHGQIKHRIGRAIQGRQRDRVGQGRASPCGAEYSSPSANTADSSVALRMPLVKATGSKRAALRPQA